MFEPTISQIAQILTIIAFGNDPIVFYVVTSKWILDGCLCYAYINDAFDLSFLHLNSPKFLMLNTPPVTWHNDPKHHMFCLNRAYLWTGKGDTITGM